LRSESFAVRHNLLFPSHFDALSALDGSVPVCSHPFNTPIDELYLCRHLMQESNDGVDRNSKEQPDD